MSLYPWQRDDWRTVQKLRERMPHAILFHGAAGIGKARFAEWLAQSLLCERPTADGQPCCACASCTWFVQGNHPDYRRVRPEALDEQEAETEVDADGKKASKTPSKDIKIDQIRALAEFMNISTHRQGLRVVVLYPADALNGASANALLKTLEEPPPGTVFLLVTSALDRLLPTILSRCRKVALAQPDRASALAWLGEQGVAQAEAVLDEHGGSPLGALHDSQSGQREEFEPYLQFLAAPSVEGALKTADKFQKAPLPQLVAMSQRWLYDLFSYKMTATLRYYPRYRKQYEQLAGKVAPDALLGALKEAGEKRAVADHPLSAKLFIEDMLLSYAALYGRR
jgi:DNA polymerase-3 subunit delta'